MILVRGQQQRPPGVELMRARLGDRRDFVVAGPTPVISVNQAQVRWDKQVAVQAVSHHLVGISGPPQDFAGLRVRRGGVRVQQKRMTDLVGYGDGRCAVASPEVNARRLVA